MNQQIIFWCLAALTVVLGGAWRRWEGANVTGFLGHRWLKLIFATLLGFGAVWLNMHDLIVSALVAAVLTASWTWPAQFGKVSNDFTWPLIPRYGATPLALALLMHFYFHIPGALFYAPVGVFAVLGYTVGKKLNPNGCWTCVGEVWLGASIYGGLFLISL